MRSDLANGVLTLGRVELDVGVSRSNGTDNPVSRMRRKEHPWMHLEEYCRSDVSKKALRSCKHLPFETLDVDFQESCSRRCDVIELDHLSYQFAVFRNSTVDSTCEAHRALSIAARRSENSNVLEMVRSDQSF